jgi:hypothetical protein
MGDFCPFLRVWGIITQSLQSCINVSIHRSGRVQDSVLAMYSVEPWLSREWLA